MRLYSVAEASALLPKVIPVLEQLRDAFASLRAVRASIAADRRGSSGDGNLLTDAWDKDAIHNRVRPMEAALEAAEAQFLNWGIEVKDPARGLIDFYHERAGEVVSLCFLFGEDSLAYWHTLDGGFAGRQPL